jgi:flavin-dependent dehydrogenase
MLASVAGDCGARVRLGSRLTACVASGSGLEVDYLRRGAIHKLRADFIVDATGRSSVLARQQGARRIRFDRLVGIAGMFGPTASTSERDTRTLVEAAPGGWWYSAWLPQSRLIVAFMTDADLIPRRSNGCGAYWRSQLDRTVFTRSRLKHLTLQGPVRIVSACSEVLDRITGRNWVAIGDAAISVDPLSSQGICWGLKSGLVAARVIDTSLNGNPTAVAELSTLAAATLSRYWQMHRIHYAGEQRWRESLFWRRRSAERDVPARVNATLRDTTVPD